MSFPTQQENPNGLHLRYFVSKANGQPVDDDADYLVFRIDDGGSDPIHINAGRVAGLAYANALGSHLPQVAADVRARCASAQPFTEASTQEALLILDNIAATPGASDALLLAAIDAVVQKLRPVPAPVHDAQALAQLEAAPMVVAGRPSSPTKCSPLSCSGCAACYKSGEPAPTTPTELPMLEGGEGV